MGRTTRSSTKEGDSVNDQTTPKVIDQNAHEKTNETASNDNRSQPPSSNEEELSEIDRVSTEMDAESGLQASIEDLKTTIDKLTQSLKRVDAKFESQD